MEIRSFGRYVFGQFQRLTDDFCLRDPLFVGTPLHKALVSGGEIHLLADHLCHRHTFLYITVYITLGHPLGIDNPGFIRYILSIYIEYVAITEAAWR